jgi:3-hydroxy-9,10-secoandrosta-1,3,5(10)-triene-9,17-dione monooxygenase reductase component
MMRTAAPTTAPVALPAPTLRRILGQFVTGVTVVTARDPAGPVGITANSFTSVSLDPPLVLFCVGWNSSSGRRIQRAGAFSVNILGREQERVSRQFAATAGNRFASVATTPGATGAPILDDALAYLECRIAEVLEGGDHAIVVGRVIEADTLRDGEPLAFFRGSYR